MMTEILKEVDEIRSFAQGDFINEDNTAYLLGSVEDENWRNAWQFLVETEERVRKLLEHIIEAKALIEEELKKKID